MENAKASASELQWVGIRCIVRMFVDWKELTLITAVATHNHLIVAFPGFLGLCSNRVEFISCALSDSLRNAPSRTRALCLNLGSLPQ